MNPYKVLKQAGLTVVVGICPKAYYLVAESLAKKLLRVSAATMAFALEHAGQFLVANSASQAAAEAVDFLNRRNR